MSGENKRDNYTIEMVVNQIAVMMLKGVVRRAEIFQYISKMDALSEKEKLARNWITVGDVSDRMIDEYVKRAREALLEIANEDVKEMKAIYIAQLEDMYREARMAGKLQTANAIMKNKMYLQGVGGVNFRGLMNVKNFDVPLDSEKRKRYHEKMISIFGEDYLKDDYDAEPDGE